MNLVQARASVGGPYVCVYELLGVIKHGGLLDLPRNY